MFENVDGRTTDTGITGILIAHLGAFGSGELKSRMMRLNGKRIRVTNRKAIWVQTACKKTLAGTLKEMPYSLF